MIDRFRDEYEFLSNFYPVEVEWEGQVYATVEHAYQAAKFADPVRRSIIQRAFTPGRAKRAAQRMAGFQREGWHEIKIHVMDGLLYQKFGHAHLAERLVQTYPHDLVEGNNHRDTFWGVCDGVGENRLGVALMRIRDELRDLL